MIANDQQLKVVRQQLERVETALSSIKRDVLPKSETRFRLMAEGYLDQIGDLRQQIDEYLGVSSAIEAQTELVIALSGKNVSLGEARSSMVTRTLEAFRRGMQTLMGLNRSEALKPKGGGRREGWIERLCDPPLIGLGRGSVKICLGEPRDDGQLFLEEDRRAYKSTLDVLLGGLAWASELGGDRPLQDAKSWHTVLSVVRQLVPPRFGEVEEINFSGRLVGIGRSYALKKATRERIDAEIKRVTPTEEYSTMEGTIREIDLDAKTFMLRERPDNLPELPCEYDELNEGDVRANLAAKVSVCGILRTSGKAKRQTMDVETVEPLSLELAADEQRG
ncbi:MAG: hypothetical protein HOP29_19635 [Phycisphaerales bacterium]|nr:hypothetical protein [Phycisphaerales bacterium]